MTDEEKYPTYHDVIDAVIAQIKVDLAKEDETAIVELLARLPRKVLLSYLPEKEEEVISNAPPLTPEMMRAFGKLIMERTMKDVDNKTN
jgi:hypothetical protein